MQNLDLNYIKNSKNKKYIFGAGRVCKSLIIALKSYNIGISAIVVTNVSNNFKFIEGIPVISLSEFSKQSMNSILILAVRNQFINEILKEIELLKIDMVFRIDAKYCIEILEKLFFEKFAKKKGLWIVKLNNYKKKLSDDEYMFFLEKQLATGNLTIEVNVADHCNLNCQSCNHFAPLAMEKYLNIDVYEKDLVRLMQVYGDKIGKVMLLGGEPLLHKQINDIISISRKILGKNVNIKVITNGLCINNMNEKFWNLCKENDVSLEYTRYPISLDYDYLEKFVMNRYGVKISNESYETVKTTYKLPLVEEKLDPYLNYMKCNLANQCIVIKEGHLYPCPIAANIDIFNKYYNKKFPTLENGVDIYEHEYEYIKDFLLNPVPMCQYCDICNYKYNIPWAISKKKLDEWM